jgi:membrane fusion protein, multidrug efflux system
MRKSLVWALSILIVGIGVSFAFPQLRDPMIAYLPQSVQGWFGLSIPPGQGTVAAQSKARGDAAPIAVSVEIAKQAEFPLVERTYGIVLSPATIAINARISSQITQVLVRDGQVVKAGDLLVTLDDRLLQAQLEKDQATLLKDQVQADSANLDLRRAQELLKKQSGTQQAYDQALAAQKALQATVAADQASVDSDKVQLTFTQIKAPIDGRLGAVQAVTGNLVSAATSGTTGSLMTITQMSPLKVSFSLPERILPDIRKMLLSKEPIGVRAFTSGTSNLLDEGALDFFDSTITTTSGTIAMSATLGNEKLALWPGQYVDLEIEHGVLPNAVVVPTVAVQPGQSGSFVWLVKDGKKVEARPVTIARADGDLTAISEGLTAGEQVVTEGQLKLKEGASVSLSSKDSTEQSASASGTTAETKASP